MDSRHITLPYSPENKYIKMDLNIYLYLSVWLINIGLSIYKTNLSLFKCTSYQDELVCVCCRHLKQLGVVVGEHSTWLKVGLGVAAIAAFALLLARALRSVDR